MGNDEDGAVGTDANMDAWIQRRTLRLGAEAFLLREQTLGTIRSACRPHGNRLPPECVRRRLDWVETDLDLYGLEQGAFTNQLTEVRLDVDVARRT
jgi:hypothetical protein